MLKKESKKNLGNCSVVSCSNFLENFIANNSVKMSQRGVCCDMDANFLAEANELRLLEENMQFDLITDRLNLRVGEQIN